MRFSCSELGHLAMKSRPNCLMAPFPTGQYRSPRASPVPRSASPVPRRLVPFRDRQGWTPEIRMAEAEFSLFGGLFGGPYGHSWSAFLGALRGG